MATKNDEDRKALVILPIVLGGAAAAYFLLRRRVVADPEKAILFGQVTDAETGHGIGGVTVNCNGYTATTGSNGHYEILNIPGGTYTVTFSHPDYETKVV